MAHIHPAADDFTCKPCGEGGCKLPTGIRRKDLHVYTHPLIRMRFQKSDTSPESFIVLFFVILARLATFIGGLLRSF